MEQESFVGFYVGANKKNSTLGPQYVTSWGGGMSRVKQISEARRHLVAIRQNYRCSAIPDELKYLL